MAIGRKRLWIAILGVVVIAVIVAANLRPKKGAKGPEVRTEEIETHKIEAWVRAPGRIQPVTKVQISSNVTGRVAEIAVIEGQVVQAGDLLLRLDDERYRSLVEQQRAQIQAGEANAALAEAEQREAQQNLERFEALAEQGLASKSDLIAARTRSEVTAARVAVARKEVQRARAFLDQGEKDLRETVFQAPIAGIVTALNVEAGENVITGTMNNPGTVILTLSDLSAMEVEAEVDETDVVNVAVGQEARVFVDALPDTTLEGIVTRVGQSGRGATGSQQDATNFEVAVLLRQPPALLRPEMNADVEILTGRLPEALAIPLQALTARPASVVRRWERARIRGETREEEDEEEEETAESSEDTTSSIDRNLVEGVFLLDEGKARFVAVRLGLRGETYVEVRGDLGPGQTLIVGPYKTVRKLNDRDEVRLAKKGGKGSKKGTDAGKDEGSEESGS